MSAVASQNTGVSIVCATVCSGEFTAQRASNAENVSIWWRHHANKYIHTKTRKHMIDMD